MAATAALGIAFVVGTQQGARALHPPCATEAPCALDLPRTEVIEGWLATEPTALGLRHRLDLDAVAIHREGRWQPLQGRIRIWVRGLGDDWRAGECMRARVWLRRPRNFGNPGAFDYAGYLRGQGIAVVGSVWQPGAVEPCRRRQRGGHAALLALRQRVRMAIDRAVAPPAAGLLRALVIGDRSGVPKQTRDAFARAGVAHVLAISGLHLAVLAGAVFTAGRFLVSRSEACLARGLAAPLAALGALPVTLAYGLLAGGRPPTLRAMLMVSVHLVGVASGRRSDVFRSMAVAALVMSAGAPDSVYDPAFRFSFTAVLSIVLAMRRLRVVWDPPGTLIGRSPGGTEHPGLPRAGLRRFLGGLAKWLLMSVVTASAAALGTAPLSAFHFNAVSLVGPMANLVVVPLFSLTVVTALAGTVVALMVPSRAAIPFQLAGLFVEVGHQLALAAASVPRAAVRVATPTLLELLLVYAFLGVLISWRHRCARVLLIGVLLVAVGDAAYWIRARYARPDLRITFLDVGQGDAAVVEFPGSAVLIIDGGGFSGSDFDPGQAVVAPFLWSRKITRVDFVAMTHADTDHAGGLAFLVDTFQPREFWWNGRPAPGSTFERLAAALDRQRVRRRVLTRETPPFALGPVEVHPLHPPRPIPASWSENDASLVLRLRWGTTTVLFSGDIEEAGERALLTSPPHMLASAVLKVPHHGSRTSSSRRFLHVVRPLVAVVSLGVRNRHGFPHPEVRRRYEMRRACLRRTDVDGAIFLRGTARQHRIEPACDTGA